MRPLWYLAPFLAVLFGTLLLVASTPSHAKDNFVNETLVLEANELNVFQHTEEKEDVFPLLKSKVSRVSRSAVNNASKINFFYLFLNLNF